MVLIMGFEIFYTFAALFVVTEISQRVTLTFEECNEMIGQFEWYLFPIEIQRLLPIVMQSTQQPIEVKCLGSVACNRETFKYVSISQFSFSRSIHFFDGQFSGDQNGLLILFGTS